jgi:uncharacterized membrane protein
MECGRCTTVARRWTRAIPIALLLVGAAAIALAIYQGTAHVSLLLIFPLVSGESAFFLLGVLCVAAGFLALPFAFPEPEFVPPRETLPSGPRPVTVPPPPKSSFGGFVLLGPVPIFFGEMRGRSSRLYWGLVALGLALTLLAIVLFLFV